MESVPYLTSHPTVRSLVRSKIITNQAYHVNFYSSDTNFIMYNFDTLEQYVYLLFQIDLRNQIKTCLYLVREYHMALSDINEMPYWWFEYYLDEVLKNQKEEEKRNKKEQKEMDAMKSSMNPNSMMRNISSSMPKMPSMGSFGAGMPRF